MAPATATLDSDLETVVDKGNGLICFTNCLLPQEDGSVIEKDLWIDGRRGVVLDSHVSGQYFPFHVILRINVVPFEAYILPAQGKARYSHRLRRQHLEVNISI